MTPGNRTGRFSTFPKRLARIRSQRRWTFTAALCAGVVVVAGVVIQMSRPPQASGAPTRPFGVLGSTCDTHRVSALATAGVQLAEVRFEWDKFEPSPGTYDANYLSQMKNTIGRCRDAGLGVVLTPGLQYGPNWVAELPAGAYRDQNGDMGPVNVPNIIFSAAARQAFADYIAELKTVLPLNTFSVIRVGTSEAGEVGYPRRDFGNASSNNFWAFDTAAQTGKDLPVGVTASPLPGWTPGSATWQSKPLTTGQVQEWFSWYTRSASQAIVWQIQLFRSYGYTGQFHVPLAGRGALPTDLKTAFAANLGGAGDRDGSLERGLYYPEQLADIAKMNSSGRGTASGRVIADVTGLDDASAVEARQQQPPQDTCMPTDAASDLLTNPHVAQWSAFRWTIANARHAGLGVVGENPGSPDAPGTGGDPASDDLSQQMTHAPKYARECGLTAMMWAFEDDLFGDTSGVSVDDYARQIHYYGEGTP
jgi:hypothetical protein